MTVSLLIQTSYFVAAVLFILGLKAMSSPKTARRGVFWAGIGMGAIWADHSWGRPWGWDPKEVFALNTFIVFVVLIHVRMSSKDKGLWTALLAVIGCGVMLFNWIVINFVISGLHSYA